MMTIYPHLIICPHCDSVHHYRALNPGEAARCTRCQATLYRSGWMNIGHRLALIQTAAILFFIANSYPVLSVSFHALQNTATLWQAALALANGATLPLAIGCFFLLIIAPFLQIMLTDWILMFANQGRCAPGFIPVMKILLWLRPWSMLEIAMLGFLIAAIKLSGFMQVIPGAGCWALAALMLLLVVVNSLELRTLWSLVPTDSNCSVISHER